MAVMVENEQKPFGGICELLRARAADYKRIHGISQAEFARRAGISQPALWRFEAGDGLLREDALDKLARFVMPDVLSGGYSKSDRGGPSADVAMAECRECGESVPSKLHGKRVNFCCVCGEPMGIPCPQCGTINDHDAKFCKGCGYALTLEAAKEKAGFEESVERLGESEDDRRKREALEKRERAKARRKRGEPDL